MKTNIKHLFTTSALVIGALWSSNAYALDACGSEGNGGASSLQVTVDISAADVTNNAAEAWNKIADAVQRQYGSNIEVGMVSLVVKANVKIIGPITGTGYVGNFPMHFDGKTSINRAILNERGIDPGGRDKNPCDPDKNACCDECGAKYAFLQPFLNIFSSGYQGKSISSPSQKIQLAEQKLLATGRRRMTA